MKLIKIFKNSTLSFFSKFDRDDKMQEWINECVSKNSWGLPERPELVLDEATGEMIPTGNILPAEYTIEIEDITAQVEQERINQEALAYLASTDFYIVRELDNGTPCPAEIKIARQEARNRIVR